MRLARGWHLAYGSGVPTDAGWPERVRTIRDGVCPPDEELGLGLRLDEEAARELLSHGGLADFRRWLAAERCYVFTLDAPPAAWTGPESLVHACRLLDGLGELLPAGTDGSVSVSLIEARRSAAELQAIYANLIHAAVHAAEVAGRTDRRVCLAVAAETPRFLEPLVDAFPDQFGAYLDAGRASELVGALTGLDRAEIPVLKLRLDHPARTVGVLDWLKVHASNGLHLETSGRLGDDDPQNFRRTLDLLAARGLA